MTNETGVSLLDKLRELGKMDATDWDDEGWVYVDALPAVVALVEAAQPFADPFHAKTEEELRAFRAALAPFVGEATQ